MKDPMIVNLAVKDQPYTIRTTMHWLISRRREIDDREAAKTETAASLIEKQRTFIIRAAMSHLIAHSLDERNVNPPFARTVFPNSADATHTNQSKVSSLHPTLESFTEPELAGNSIWPFVSCYLASGRWTLDFGLWTTFNRSAGFSPAHT